MTNQPTYSSFTETTQLMQKHHLYLDQIAQLALDSQIKYDPQLTIIDASNALNQILHKREVQHIVITALSLDQAVQDGHIESKALQYLVSSDNPNFGIDEALAYQLTDRYGTIASTNYGKLDQDKPGIIGQLDQKGKTTDEITTFADDIAGALAAATASKLANASADKYLEEGENN